MPVSRTRVTRTKTATTSGGGGGLGRVEQAASRQKGDKLWVAMDDGESVVLRVLDVGADFKDVYVHRVPFERENGSTYHLDVPCLDQDEEGIPCPGCADEVERRYKFYCNVIWRDYKDPDGGKNAKAKDVLAIFSGGISVAKQLIKRHKRFGLQNRDIVVEREGKKLDTKYDVDWVDEKNTPLSAEDKKLAEGRFDFKRYLTPPEFDDFYKLPKDRDNDEAGGADYEASTKRTSPFAGERKSRTTTNRSSSGSKTTARSKSSPSADKPKAGLAALRANKKAPEGKSSTGKRTVTRRIKSR